MLFIVFFTVSSTPVHAEKHDQKYTSEFLAPKGHWAVDFNFNYAELDKRHNESGDLEDLGDVVSGVELDVLAPMLNDPALNAALGGGLTLGQAELDLSYQFRALEMVIGYGVTEDVSIGTKFVLSESCADVSLSTVGTTVPGFDINSVLRTHLGYREVGDNCVSGLMAPALGALWRIYNGVKDSLILTPSVRLGRIARHQDADVIFEPLMDDGSNDFVFQIEYFRDMNSSLDLHAKFEYSFQKSDRVEKRVPVLPMPVSPSITKESLHRKLGDYYLVDVELGYRFSNDSMRTFLGLYQKSKAKDKYRSDISGRITALEENSDFVDTEARVGMSYNGVSAWRAGRLPLPLMLELNYWQSIDGENYVEYQMVEFHISTGF